MTTLEEIAVVRTERLTLRPLRMEDAGRVFALFADWEVIRWLDAPPWPYALKDAEDFIGRQNPQPDFADTALAITHDGAVIGGIGAHAEGPGVGQRGPGLHIGYWLGRPYWNHGFMTEAARALIARLFATRTDEILYSGVFAGNAASWRVQDKLGFVRDGEAMMFSRPHGREIPHINTVLTRARFEHPH